MKNGPREGVVWARTLGLPTPSHAQRQIKLRQAKQGTQVPPDLAHGVYTYRVYRCRCDICIAAKQAGDQRRRIENHWTTRARGRYSEGKDGDGSPTTIVCWPPRNAPPDWVCPDPSHQEA